MPKKNRTTMAWLCSIALVLAFTQGGDAASRRPSRLDKIAEQSGLGPEVIGLIRQEAGGELHRLVGYDETGYQIMVKGIAVSLPHARTEQVRASLLRRLRPHRCMAFIIEESEALGTDRIAVVRGTDPYGILGIMHTNGARDEVSHETVVETLRHWERRFPFEIVGAENEWVEIEFRDVPKDMSAFADEVAAFCPDAVDAAGGSLDALIQEVRETRRLLLRWE